MNFSSICQLDKSSLYKEFARNEWVIIRNESGRLDMCISFRDIPEIFRTNMHLMRDDHNAIGYVYIINELYDKGLKVVKPTLEQCLAFENIEISIPFKDYKQPFETMMVEYPEEYVQLLRNRYKIKAPIACICHRPDNKEYLMGALSFGIESYNITFFITNNDTVMEELVQWNDEKIRNDPDFLPTAQAERVAFNTMLFMTNFGSQKIGYSNVKQHRFYERKKPELAGRDFYYYGLNQEIKLFERKVVKSEPGEGHHASPISHWRRGFWRNQRYGPNNSLTKLIFIAAVFVCSEKYKGNLSDTKVIYK